MMISCVYMDRIFVWWVIYDDDDDDADDDIKKRKMVKFDISSYTNNHMRINLKNINIFKIFYKEIP